MSDDSASLLAEIREREEASSRGPWAHDAGYGFDPVTGRITLDAVTGPWTLADLEFIAHARTDVPRLLAAVDKALELAGRWQESRSRLYERAEQLGDPRMTTDILAEARQLEWCTEDLRSAVLAALTGKGEVGG